jgi:hypothetical protein
MLDDKQKEALGRWYRRPEIVDEARKHIERERWEDLEELIQMRSLLPLEQRRDLPDYLHAPEGEPLLPSLNPRNNLEAWQDAVEVGWAAMEAELDIKHDDIHSSIAREQKDDWESFLKSVEERKRQRAGNKADQD